MPSLDVTMRTPRASPRVAFDDAESDTEPVGDGDGDGDGDDDDDSDSSGGVVPTAKYVEGIVNMARGGRTLQHLNQRLGGGYRRGVLIINLEDGGSLLFFKTRSLTLSSTTTTRGGGSSSVRASMESYVKPFYEEPGLRIPAIVPWEFKAISENSFQIVVPPTPEGKLDDRVNMINHRYLYKKMSSKLLLLDDGTYDDGGGSPRLYASRRKRRSTSGSRSTSSSTSTTQVFLFRVNLSGELAIYAKAAWNMDRNSADKTATGVGRKFGILAKSNVRSRTAAQVELAKQGGHIGRSRSVVHVPVRRESSIGVPEYRCFPLYCYPSTWMTKGDLAAELNRSSKKFHDFRQGSPDEIGSVTVEVLQCIGLPKLDRNSLTDAYCFIVCGSNSFATDVIPENINPAWLPLSRRATILPIHNAYSQVYVGVFDYDGEKQMDDFAGRVVIDIPQLHAGLSVDITLPLRECSNIYDGKQRGSIRLRIKLDWEGGGERAALLSYLPKKMSDITRRMKPPNDQVTVACPDAKSFHNVVYTVYGKDIPGKYNKNMKTAVSREVRLIKSMLIYHMKKSSVDIVTWKTPLLSLYIFCGWMYSVAINPASIPAWILSLLLIFMMRNYLKYHVNSTLAGIRGHKTIGDMVLILLINRDLKLKRDQRKKWSWPKDGPAGKLSLIERMLCQIFGVQHANGKPKEDSWRFGDHAEFPFSLGSAYPKRTSGEAAAKPIWEAAQDVRASFNEDDENSIDINFSDQGSEQDVGDYSDSDDEIFYESEGGFDNRVKRVTFRGPNLIQPADQNIENKGVSQDIREHVIKFHSHAQKANLHLFDDRVFIADDGEKVLKFNSTKNPILRWINPILGNMIKLFLIEVSAFRAVFNILFWKDPMLSFWAMAVVFSLIIFILIFPWQKFFLVIGFVGLGPQNFFLVDHWRRYLCRIKNKRADGNDDHVIPGRNGQNADLSASPLLMRDNIQRIPDGKRREVIVPSIPFRYNRFYDWPPDPALLSINKNSTAASYATS